MAFFDGMYVLDTMLSDKLWASITTHDLTPQVYIFHGTEHNFSSHLLFVCTTRVQLVFTTILLTCLTDGCGVGEARRARNASGSLQLRIILPIIQPAELCYRNISVMHHKFIQELIYT